MAKVEGPWTGRVSEADCWPFLADWRSRFGYGRIREGGADSRILPAHRAMYELTHGPIPAGQIARHTCNTPACCNPAHIVPGSYQDNYLDELAAGYPSLPERRRRR